MHDVVYAYVDPGVGLFAVQALLSAVVGAMFMMRDRLKTWFAAIGRYAGMRRRNPGPTPRDDERDPDPE